MAGTFCIRGIEEKLKGKIDRSTHFIGVKMKWAEKLIQNLILKEGGVLSCQKGRGLKFF